MRLSTSALAASALLASLVSGQTPPGFTPEVKARLDLQFQTKVVQTPGTSLTRAESARQPTIGTSDGPLNGTNYLWMMIDLDVPGNFQNPSSAPRRTNLHALITSFKPTAITPNSAGIYPLSTTATGPITYVGPGPPPENPPHAHRYVSLLYETPEGFSVTRAQVGQTLGFNLTAFVSAVGLVGALVRANYFNVTG